MQLPVCRRSLVAGSIAVVFSALALPQAFARENQKPILARSPNDAALQAAICRLSPTVRPDEAAQVTRCAFETGRELRKQWGVLWPPGLQNFLVNQGVKKGGLCYQWAEELLVRLDRLKLQSIELHWAEAEGGTRHEHNVIVVTAKGQPFSEGVLLDNWRFGGSLAWGPVLGDTGHPWLENKRHFANVLNARNSARRAHPSPEPTGEQAAAAVTATRRSEPR